MMNPAHTASFNFIIHSGWQTICQISCLDSFFACYGDSLPEEKVSWTGVIFQILKPAEDSIRKWSWKKKNNCFSLYFYFGVIGKGRRLEDSIFDCITIRGIVKMCSFYYLVLNDDWTSDYFPWMCFYLTIIAIFFAILNLLPFLINTMYTLCIVINVSII